MSEKKRPAGGPPPGGPGGGNMMMLGEKPKDFKATFRRLLRYLRPRRTALIGVFSQRSSVQSS